MQAKLRADPSLLPGAIEELLRLYGIASTPRRVMRDDVCHGVQFKKGDTVLLLLPAANYDDTAFQNPEQFVIGRTAWIVAEFKKRHPDVPLIGFPKGAGGKLGAYARETGVDAVGLDETVDPFWANRALPDNLPVQGNLDPLALLAGGEPMRQSVRRILDALGGRPHIFNLGHGISKETPIAHVEELVELVKAGG